MGFGAELSALMAEHMLEYLEAPIIRVAGFDTPVPFALDEIYIPTPNRVASAIRKVSAYL